MRSKLAMWIAWHLPESVVMWCSIRIAAYATQGAYSDQVVPELTALDAVDRWMRR